MGKVCKECIQGLIRIGLGSRNIRLGWAQKNSTLLVFDLAESVSRGLVIEIFSAFGELDLERTHSYYDIYVRLWNSHH